MSVDLERPRARRAEYERFLARKLAHARNRIKAVDVASGIVICAVGAVAYALTVTMLDQIFTLSATARISLLALFAVGTLAYAAFAVILPSLRRVNLLFAAREVERADPNTKNSLINWLQLHDREEGIPEPILRAIEARAASDLKRIDLGEAIQTTHILRASYVLAGVVVAFCLFLFATTKEIGPSLRRVLFPLAEIAPPTETKLTQIEPGSTEIAAGDKVTVSAFASGKEPKSVTAYVTADNGEYWEPIPLAQTGGAFSRWQVTLNDRQRSFDYYLAANDFESPRYRVTVTAAPMVTEWKATYHFPAYTGERSRTDLGGDIDALEGTEVDIAVRTNVPVRPGSGRLELTFGKERRAETMKEGQAVEPGDIGDAGEAGHALAARIKLAQDGGYQVSFDDLLGRKPPFRPVKNIRVRRDLVPVLGFVEPKESDIQRPANATVALRLSASDDYGLASIRVIVARATDREVLLDEELSGDAATLGRSKVWVVPVELARMRLKTGDTLVYWAEAQDNKLPVSNVVSTKDELRTIEIIEPPKPKNPPPFEEKAPGEKQKNPKEKQDLREGQDPQPPPPEQREGQRQEREGSGKEGQSKEGQNKEGQTKEGQSSQGQSKEGQSKERQSKEGQAGEHSEPGQQGAERSGEQGEAGDESDAGQSERERASEEDRESLEKLKRHFDKKDGKSDEAKREPAGEKKDQSSDGSDSKGAEEKGDPAAKSGARRPEQQDGEREKAAKEAKADSKNKPEAKQPDRQADLGEGEDQGAKQPSEGEKDQAAKEGTGAEEGKDSQDQGGTRESKEKQGGGEKQNESSRGAQKSDDSGRPTKTGKPDGAEAPENGAGREGQKSKDQPQGEAQPGQPSEKDQGKESGGGKDGQPPPGSDRKPAEKPNAKGAHKEGKQDSAAQKEGNTEGQSSQGESSQSGKSSTGSPSEEQGDNPQSRGEQKGKGNSEGAESKSEESKESQSGDKAGKEKQGGSGQGSESKETRPQNGDEKSAERSSSNQPDQPGEGDSETKGDPSEEAKPGPAGGDPYSKRPETDNRPIGEPSEEVIDNTGEASDPEDLKRGSNLVLKRLKDELKNKEVDPELLKDMGWTEEDAWRFADRMEKPPPPEAPKDPLVGKEREGFGGGTKLQKTAKRGAGNVSDQTGDLFQGRRAPPPPEYRALYEAYTRSLSGAGGTPAPKATEGEAPPPAEKKP